MSIHDDQLHLASADEMSSRDERESIMDQYDDPSMPDGSDTGAAKRAPLTIVSRAPITPTCERFAFLADIDTALAQAGCCPDGYMNLSAGETYLVDIAKRDGWTVEQVAQVLIEYRKEGQLFSILHASTKLEALRADMKALGDAVHRIANHVQPLPSRDDLDAIVADVETLRGQVDALSMRKAS